MTLEAIHQNAMSLQELAALYLSVSQQQGGASEAKKAKLQAYLLKLCENISKCIHEERERYSS